MMDGNDEAGLKRFAWAVYNGVLLLGEMPTMSGQNSLDRIPKGAYMLIYREKEISKHCPSCTIRSANVELVLRRAK